MGGSGSGEVDGLGGPGEVAAAAGFFAQAGAEVGPGKFVQAGLLFGEKERVR